MVETGDEHGTGIKGGLWNGKYSGTPLVGVKEVMAGKGAAGKSATLWDDTWLGAEPEIEPVAGRRTGDGTETGTGGLVGHALGSRAGTELEADETEVMARAAPGF